MPSSTPSTEAGCPGGVGAVDAGRSARRPSPESRLQSSTPEPKVAHMAHATAANKKGRAKTLLLGPLGGHAPLDRRRGEVELVVQRLLDEVQQRALDGAEDHLLEVCVAQQSM